MSRRSASGPAVARGARGPAKVLHLPVPTLLRRQRALRAGATVLVISLATAIAARIYLIHALPPSAEEIAGLSEIEADVVRAVNQARARASLPVLKFSPRLAVIARGHSYDMAIRNYFARSTPEGATAADRVRGVGVEGREIAENIYLDTLPDLNGLGSRAVEQWLKTPETRASLLSPRLTETGVGLARSADGRTYLTQDSSD